MAKPGHLMQDAKALEPYARCGATRRNKGVPCRNPAGFRTDHTGQGRCYLHGGATPVRTGRYSTIVRDSVAEIHEQLEAEPDSEKLNVLPEATMIRALAADFVDRYHELVDALLEWNSQEYVEAEALKRKPRPQRIPELREAAALLEAATRVIDRIHKQHSENAISRPDLLRLMAEMGRVVEAHVLDDETRQSIKEGWLAIRVA